jgi:hypothetical protein
MSIVSVDNIQPIGSGTSVTVNSAATLVLNNANSTGVVTATTFVGNLTGNPTGSGANLTNLPAANLTGTLPAISGANLTNLPAANLTGTLPAISGANLTGLISGITEFDYWYLTTSVTSDSDLTSNLIRNDRVGITPSERIGTGMSESSGVFTFPNTGKWLVFVIGGFVINGSDSVALDTQVTLNNSSYSTHARVNEGNNGSGARSGSGTSLAFIDVTDTSQVKVKFNVGSLGSGSYLVGNSASYISTAFIFVRIGDT